MVSGEDHRRSLLSLRDPWSYSLMSGVISVFSACRLSIAISALVTTAGLEWLSLKCLRVSSKLYLVPVGLLGQTWFVPIHTGGLWPNSGFSGPLTSVLLERSIFLLKHCADLPSLPFIFSIPVANNSAVYMGK